MHCSHAHLRLHQTSHFHHARLHQLHTLCSNSLTLLLCSHRQSMKPVIRSLCLARYSHRLKMFSSSSHNIRSLLVELQSSAHHNSQCPTILSIRLWSGLDLLPVWLQDLVHKVPMVHTTCVRHLECLSI